MLSYGPSPDLPDDPMARILRSLGGPGVAFAFASSGERPDPILESERRWVSRAVASRQREFAQGRWCARAALGLLGIPAVAIPVGADRAPRWPPGVVGSITHCAGFVGALVASASQLRGIGFDAELAAPLDADLRAPICVPAELEWIAATPPPPGGDWSKLHFSVKEAIHKCIAPITDTMLDFGDVTISIDREHGTFRASPASKRGEAVPLVSQISGRFAFAEQLVLSVAQLSP